MEKKSVKLRIKEVNSTSGTFTGHAAVFNVVDLGNDKIIPGAFSKTIGIRSGKVPILDNHNNVEIGMTTELKEDTMGLYFKGQLYVDNENPRNEIPASRDALARMTWRKKMGKSQPLSFGYEVERFKFEKDGDNQVRILEELNLWEISPVVFPMNPSAMVDGVKSVVPFQDLPLAEQDMEWDSAAALQRVRAATNSEEMPSESYRKAFLWFDSENSDSFGAYKLPIADVVNDRMVAVPRGVFAAAGVIMDARGGVDIPEADMAAIKAHLGRYYQKLDATPPWEEEAGMSLIISDCRRVAEELKGIIEGPKLPLTAKVHGDDTLEGIATLLETVKDLRMSLRS